MADSNGRGHWGLTSHFAEFYRKRFSRKLYISVSHHPLFLLLEFVNSVSDFWLLIYLFFYCLFVYLPRERLISVIHAPSENILDAHSPYQTILQLIRSFRRKNRLMKHSSPVDEGGGSNFVLSAKAIFHWTKWVNFLGDEDHEKRAWLWCPCLKFAESHSLHDKFLFYHFIYSVYFFQLTLNIM